jgi:ferredoxin-type protein NapF
VCQGFDPARRHLLTGRRLGTPPPWADPERLHDLCTRCGACERACPEGIVIASEGALPAIDFHRGECTFCGACAEACPLPIFDRRGLPWAIRAAIGERCLTLRGVVCQSCADACPTRAIGFAPVVRSVPRPRVDLNACTGCGACVAGCPTAAITLREPAAHA